MRKLAKSLLRFLSFFSPTLKNYVFEWKLFGRVPFSVLFINFIFQRLLRYNSKVPFSTHFTSRVIGFDKIKLHQDPNTVGSFCMSPSCYIQANNGLEIGKNFLFGPGVKIISNNHGVNDEYKNSEIGPIKIGENVWLGANAILLPGIELGNNVVVGAGSVVTKSFPDGSVIGGNPAKLLKQKS